MGVHGAPPRVLSGDGKMERARGLGRIGVAAESGRTRLVTLREEGCAKVRLPRTHDHTMQAVLINTTGGLAGGDQVRWEAAAGPGASLALTTQACERAYRSLGDDAEIAIKLTADAGGRLDWLPQETILYEGSRLKRRLEVDLAADATFCAVEAIILGRTAMGETAPSAVLVDDWRIRRGGRLIHAEATKLRAEPEERAAPSLLNGATAFATVLYIGDDAECRLAGVREALGATAGASLVGERLTVRAVAPSGLALRRMIGPVVAALAGSLPRLWHI